MTTSGVVVTTAGVAVTTNGATAMEIVFQVDVSIVVVLVINARRSHTRRGVLLILMTMTVVVDGVAVVVDGVAGVVNEVAVILQ